MGTEGKLVNSNCYDKQQVCLTATVLMLDALIAVKQRFRSGVPLFDVIVRGVSPHPAARNLVTRN